MKPTLKFITVPLSFWNCETLSLNAKWVAITIDSYTSSPDGVLMGVKAIQTATNLNAKEVKEALVELKEKGCIEVNMNDDGEKLLKVYLYKDNYKTISAPPTIGDKPTDTVQIDFQFIQENWNSICTTLPKLERITPRRKTRTRSTLKQADLTVEDLIKCFRIIACTPFLSGESNQFKCTYDWLTANSQNLTKVYEGFYSRSYQEKNDYEIIMNGISTTQKQSIYK